MDFEEKIRFKEEEAIIFANEFYCPQAFMIKYNLRTISDLISSFDITEGYATVLLKKLALRNIKCLSKNELRLIEIFEKNKKIYKKYNP